ncbi:MAG TPA: DMT family transporter [Bacteroidota bacterium]|nr:DMT family transporter [Bacteroidota bacterium]
MSREGRIPLLRIELELLGVVLLWSANYPLMKYALSELNPFVFNSIRYIVAAVVLVLLFHVRSEWRPIERTDRKSILLIGLEGHILYQIAFILGLSMTTAGNAAVLLSTSPLWTLVLDARIHREKIPAKMWIGMGISLIGIILVVTGSGAKHRFDSHEVLGDLIALAAALLWALNIVLQKPVLVKYSPSQLAVMMNCLGAVGLSFCAIPAATTFVWGSIDWKCYAAAILSGALSIGIGNTIWSRGISKIGPGRTSNFNNLVPILALILSWLTLHEQLSVVQLVGAVITIIGVWTARGGKFFMQP